MRIATVYITLDRNRQLSFQTLGKTVLLQENRGNRVDNCNFQTLMFALEQKYRLSLII